MHLKTLAGFAAILTLAVSGWAAPSLGGTSYSGTLATDDATQSFSVTLPAPGPLTIHTYSYAGGTNQAGSVIPAGGFDPTVTVFDSLGNYLVSNRDGGCGPVAADPTTHFCWDAYLALTLPAGTYTVVLSQSENLANGPTLADSFIYAGQTTFTTPPGQASAGFWDAFPSKRTNAFAVDVLGGASTVTSITSPSALAFGVVGRAYVPVTFTAQAATGATLTWSLVNGTSLPTGMTLNSSTGILSGTPQSAGTFPLTVQVTDGALPAVTKNLSLLVYAPLFITTSSLPGGTGGQAYGPQTLLATGGSGGYSWTVSGLPANLSATTAGVISGTPVQGGTFPLTVTVSDSVAGLSASVNLSLSVTVPALSVSGVSDLGAYLATSNVSSMPTVSGGVPPYVWTASGLPAGFSLNAATGAYSGTAGAPGSHSFSLKVTDSQIPPASSGLSVSYSVLGITTPALPNGSTTSPYTATITAAGGTGPYTFSAVGALPGGLSLSSAGVLSGTPTTPGNTSITIKVASGALSTTATFAINIAGPSVQPLTVTSTTLSAATVGSAYAGGSSLQASGGTAPYTWSVFGGTLPAGLSLQSSGIPSGTPSLAGTYQFTAQVTDSKGVTATAPVSLLVNPATLSLTLGSFPTGIVGITYPGQVLTATGGTAPYTFQMASGSALPDGLSLSGQQISGTPTKAGTFAFTVVVTDAAGKTANGAGSIVITPPQTNLILSSTNVSFSLVAGASGVPTPGQVTVRSSVPSILLNYSYAVSPAASWLNLTGGTTTPGSLSLAIDPSAPSLTASSTPYTTTLTITCLAPASCAGVSQTVNVSLTVAAPPPQLVLTAGILSFNAFSANPVGSSQSLGLQNAGGGVITVNSITTGASWLTVSGVPATLASGPATQISVNENPAGLGPGYYTTTLTVNTSAGTASIPVTLLVAQSLTMSVAPSGSQFSAPAGSSPGNPAGSFSVTAAGTGTVNWTAFVAPGANWLTLNTASGSATAGAASTVNFSLNPTVVAGLAPASYYATIQVSAAGVVNSPQQYQVVLNITPASIAVSPVLSSAGLVFSASAGTTAQSQSITVYSGSSTATTFQASAAATNGGLWLSVSPTTGSASVGSPGQSSVSVNTSGLLPGIYYGGVSYAFSSDAVSTVNVTLLVLRPTGSARGGTLAQATGCTPTQLIGTQTGLYNNFAQAAGWPTPLSVSLIDDCGTPVNGASMTTTFSNGDPPLALSPRDTTSGVYLGTWTPRTAAPQVTVTATARSSPFPAAVSRVTGQVRTNSAPILTPNAVLDVFNPVVGSGLAPGQVVQIYGTNLATQTVIAPSAPLPTALSGTSVLIGGISAPLYYVSPGQINAQIPFELKAGTQYQILVQVNGALSTPMAVQLVSVSPGIANIGGQAIAQHAADYSLVTPTSPAKPGEFVIIYLSGLGATDVAVNSGAASPSNPLSHPLTAPVLTLNGNTIPTAFAGLSPSAVGLYQINFQVPAGTLAGNATLSVSQSGSASSQLVIPVGN